MAEAIFVFLKISCWTRSGSAKLGRPSTNDYLLLHHTRNECNVCDQLEVVHGNYYAEIHYPAIQENSFCWPNIKNVLCMPNPIVQSARDKK